MADSIVSASGVYVATEATGNSTVSASGVYVATEATGNSTVSAAFVYVATIPPPVGGVLKVAGNVTVTINSVAITNYIDNSRLEAIVKAFQSTVFSSAAEQSIPTQAAWAFPLGGKWSIESDGVLALLALQKTEVPFVVTFGTVSYSWLLAFLADYTVTAPAPREAIVWLASVACQGVPTWSGG